MHEKEKEMALACLQLASKKIMEIYQRGFHVELKQDDSPVTEADRASEAIIKAAIQSSFKEDGILSEESDDDLSRLQKKRVWIIDPLDGTKEFVRKSGQFAINLALAIDGKLVAGFIASPTEDKIYYAFKGQGSYLFEKGSEKRLYVSSRDIGELIPVSSNSKSSLEEMARFVSNHKESFASSPIPLGSSLKMAQVAEGKADFFYRFSNVTKEWDVAPGDLLVQEAGGFFLSGVDFKPFEYNKKDVVNHQGYLMGNKTAFSLAELAFNTKNL